MEDHVAGVEAYHSVGVGGTIVKSLEDRLHGFGSWGGLLGGDCTESGDDGAIDGTTVEEEDTNDFLDSSFVSGWKLVAGVVRWCKLCFGTVVGFRPGMGRVLGFGRMWVSEAK